MEAWIVIGLLVVAVVAFATEKISVDLVTLGLLCVLVLSGILRVDQAFGGFGDRVIILLAAIFVIGAALRETGVLDALGAILASCRGGRHIRLMHGLLAVVAAVSVFLDTTLAPASFRRLVTAQR